MRLTESPSLLTRVLAFRPAEDWLRRYYLPLTVVPLALLIFDEFHVFGPHLQRWDWLFVTGWVTFLLTFKATFLLPHKVDAALDRLAASQVLVHDENTLSDFKRDLHESCRRAASIGGIVVAVVLALAWIVAKRGALPSYLLTVLLEVAGAFLAGSFIVRAVTYGRLGQRLKKKKFTIKAEPEHLDGVAGLRPIGRLYFFQSAIIAVAGVFLAAWWLVIPLFGDRYSGWRGVYAGLLVFVVFCEFLTFFAPMWSFHRIMTNAKANLLTEADQISEEVTRIQEQLRTGVDDGLATQLQDKLVRQTNRYNAIVEMPTWPVDKPIRRRFALNNLFLFIPVIAQAVGAPSSWQHLLDTGQKFLSGQG